MSKNQLLHSEITEDIIKAFFHVYNTLGHGFLEKVYENSLSLSLKKMGYQVDQQIPLSVHFEGELVGEYFADLLVNRKVLIELKAAETLHESHIAQLLNYLKATRMEVGLLLNFGPKPQFKRKIFTNDLK
jgi:GxxExxY protein